MNLTDVQKKTFEFMFDVRGLSSAAWERFCFERKVKPYVRLFKTSSGVVCQGPEVSYRSSGYLEPKSLSATSCVEEVVDVEPVSESSVEGVKDICFELAYERSARKFKKILLSCCAESTPSWVSGGVIGSAIIPQQLLLCGGAPPRKKMYARGRPRRRGGGSQAGNGNRPPRVLGSQQIQTQIKIKERPIRRAFTFVANVTSSATSTVVVDICTNQVLYNVPVGTGTSVASADTTNYAANFSLYKIKRVEVVWNAIIAPSTAVPPLYVCYDPELSDADFSGSANIGVVINYNDHVRFDPRMSTSFIYKNKPPSSTGVANIPVMGGWLPTSVIGSATAPGVFTFPGVISIQGVTVGAAALLGRVEVIYDIAFKDAR